MKRYLKFGIPIAAILGTVAWLAMTGIGETKSYFKTLPELEKMGYLVEGVIGSLPG